MLVYIDHDYRCHVSNDGTYKPVETDYFDGKCDAYIEGYRYIPAGETWTTEGGTEFSGEMIAPWLPWNELDAVQRAYELELIRKYEAALQEIEAALGVEE